MLDINMFRPGARGDDDNKYHCYLLHVPKLDAAFCSLTLKHRCRLSRSTSLCFSTCLGRRVVNAEKGGNPELVRESQRRRFKDPGLVDCVMELDQRWRKGEHAEYIYQRILVSRSMDACAE